MGGTRLAEVEGSCEHGDEPSASIKCWKFLSKHIDGRHFRIDPVLFKKTIPLTGHGGLWCCGMSRVPQYLDNGLTDGFEIVSLTRWPLSDSKKHY
jgi:hypothetical protein